MFTFIDFFLRGLQKKGCPVGLFVGRWTVEKLTEPRQDWQREGEGRILQDDLGSCQHHVDSNAVSNIFVRIVAVWRCRRRRNLLLLLIIINLKTEFCYFKSIFFLHFSLKEKWNILNDVSEGNKQNANLVIFFLVNLEILLSIFMWQENIWILGCYFSYWENFSTNDNWEITRRENCCTVVRVTGRQGLSSACCSSLK